MKGPVNSSAPPAELVFVRGDGTRTLATTVSRSWPPGFGDASLAAGDFDGDGADDAVQTPSRYISETEPRDRRGFVVDIDADGRPDLLVPTDDGIRVFLNRWEGRP